MQQENEKPTRLDATGTFTESPVSFTSFSGAVSLAGTLVIPCTGRLAPTVVLVPGTGLIDRDVTFANHALFRVLAHSLARAGIASLRFDKRGVGESDGDFSSAGPDDFADDVIGAMEYLVERGGFARERTGMVGHSEGGLVALTAASRMLQVPFCTILASPLLPGIENFIHSLALMARGSLERDSEYDEYVSELTTLIKIARTDETSALKIATKLAPRIVNEKTAAILGTNNLSGTEFLNLLSAAVLQTCLNWEPSRIVPLVKCPVLVVYASNDVQTPARENLAAAHALLDRLERRDWEVREIVEMNHAFQRCSTGMPDEYANIDHVMAEEAIQQVAAWINSRITM